MSMTRRAPEDDGAEQSAVTAADAQHWPNLVFQKLREFDVRHVTYVPDAGQTRLLQLSQGCRAIEPTVLTTGEEGIGILAAAWSGGERGVLMIQRSGVRNCINVLSLAKVCRLALLT